VAPRKLLEGANLFSRIFLWVFGEHYIRARVNWVDFYAKKEVGGLGPIDPIGKPMVGLPCKWAVMALEPGESNLKTQLCYKLAACCKPSCQKSWTPDLNWSLVGGYISSPGSKTGQIM